MLKNLARQAAFFGLLLAIIGSLSFVASPAQAQGTPSPAPGSGSEDYGLSSSFKNIDIGGAGQTTDLYKTIASIINIALGFLGVLAVLYILFGGFKWMTAAGNEEQVGEARKIIVQGVVGLVIIFSAWAIASFVVNRFKNIAVDPGEAMGACYTPPPPGTDACEQKKKKDCTSPPDSFAAGFECTEKGLCLTNPEAVAPALKCTQITKYNCQAILQKPWNATVCPTS